MTKALIIKELHEAGVTHSGVEVNRKTGAIEVKAPSKTLSITKEKIERVYDEWRVEMDLAIQTAKAEEEALKRSLLTETVGSLDLSDHLMSSIAQYVREKDLG